MEPSAAAPAAPCLSVDGDFSFDDVFEPSPGAARPGPAPCNDDNTHARLSVATAEELNPAAASAPCLLADDAQSGQPPSSTFEAGTGDLAPQRVSMDSFELLCTVGVGAFGKVIQVQHKSTQRIFALKIMRKDTVVTKKAVEYIKTESDVMQHTLHPFIIGLHCAFQTEGKLYLVMDFANGGPLWTLLKKETMLSEQVVQFYVAEIALALEHLHDRGIVHRDLKPENILVDHEGHIRVTDFGLAKKHVSGMEGAKSFCGTDDYIAPEIIKGGPYGKAVDWWSLGALMYDMLTGRPPFVAPNRRALYKKICSEKIKFPPYLTGPAVALMKGLLHRDPSKRWQTGANFRQHKFFKNINWKRLLERRVTPPLSPNVADKFLDVSNFSPQFTSMPARDTPTECVLDRDPFAGFSFTASPSFWSVSPKHCEDDGSDCNVQSAPPSAATSDTSELDLGGDDVASFDDAALEV